MPPRWRRGWVWWTLKTIFAKRRARSRGQLPAWRLCRLPSGQRQPGEAAALLANKTRVDPLLLRYALALQALHSKELAPQVAQLRDRFQAMSVVLAALNNLFPVIRGSRWVVAFFFGLIHGFGFASVLSDLELPRSVLASALVGFNLGVELGTSRIVACSCRSPISCAGPDCTAALC